MSYNVIIYSDQSDLIKELNDTIKAYATYMLGISCSI